MYIFSQFISLWNPNLSSYSAHPSGIGTSVFSFLGSTGFGGAWFIRHLTRSLVNGFPRLDALPRSNNSVFTTIPPSS